jgi:putative transposase
MYFFTATINSWKHLLQEDEFKDVIIDSLRWLDKENKAFTHGFVIMPNHIHLLWSFGEDEKYDPVLALKSYTAHQFKKKLGVSAPQLLEEFVSTQMDREYHFWERRSRNSPMANRIIAEQKLDYIHHNPLQEKWQLATLPELYSYSSASYYLLNESEFDFLKHYMDFI